MWRKIVAVIGFGIILAGCSASDLSIPDPHRNCADLTMKVLTTDGTVKGSWNCVDKDMQNAIKARVGKEGDEVLSGPSVVHHFKLIGPVKNGDATVGYVYQTWEENSKGAVIFVLIYAIAVDPDGKIRGVAIAR